MLLIAVMIFSSFLGYIPVPLYHSLNVQPASKYNENVQTSSSLIYTVTFQESGLPDGFLWSLQFGIQYSSTQGNSITFTASQGTYNYFMYYGNQTTYMLEGSVLVNDNTIVPLNIYAVSIVLENDTLNRTWISSMKDNTGYLCSRESNGNNATHYYVPAGSYSYSISILEFGQFVLVCDNYTYVSGNLQINEKMHSVNFTETGIPVGSDNLSWGVTLCYYSDAAPSQGKIIVTSNSPTFNVYFPYSTIFADYALNIINQGITYNPAYGDINVSRISESVDYAFSNITVKAEYLPYGTQWGVEVLSSNQSIQDFGFRSSSSTGSLYLLIGSYQYRYFLYSGYSCGKPTYESPYPTNLSIPYTGSPLIANYSGVVSLKIEEHGLGQDAGWEALVSGQNITFILSGQNKAFLAYVASGAYFMNFSARSTSLLKGSCYIINDPDNWVNVSFYKITFDQAGLVPFNATWSLQLFQAGRTGAVSTNFLGATTDISLYLINGSFSYSLNVFNVRSLDSTNSIFGYTTSAQSLTISGSGQTVNIQFYLKPGYYTVNFIVQFNGPGDLYVNLSYYSGGSVSHLSFNPSIYNQSEMWILHNGTLQVLCYSGGYNNQTFPTVHGPNNSIVLNLTWLEYSTVVFEEKGLPSGIEWDINVSGETHASSSSRIFFTFTNRIVSFSVASSNDYSPSPKFGEIFISSRAEVINISFAPGQDTPLGIVNSTVDLLNDNLYNGLFSSYPGNLVPCALGYSSYDERLGNQMAVSGSGSQLYLPVIGASQEPYDTSMLQRYSESTNSIISFINPSVYYSFGASSAEFVGISPNGSCLYVSSINHLFMINSQSLKPVGFHVIGPSGFTITSMIIDYKSGKMYAIDSESGGIEVVGMNGSNMAYVSIDNVTQFSPGLSDYIVCNPANGYLYIHYNGGRFVCFNTNYDVLGETFNVGYCAIAATVIPSQDEIAVVGCSGAFSGSREYDISLLDGSNLHFIKNSTLQNQPTDLLYNQNDEMLYVLEKNASLNAQHQLVCNPGAVVVISPGNLTNMEQIPVGFSPDGMELGNGGSTIFVLDPFGGTLVIIHVSKDLIIIATLNQVLISSIIIAVSMSSGIAAGYALFYRRQKS